MNFSKLLVSAAFAAVAFPSVALAQSAPPGGAPSSDMQQIRANAKTAAMNDLSADHQAAVQAIVQKFDAGTITMSDAASQIDAVLTPDETKAVLAENQKFRDAMRAQFAANGGPPGGGPPGGGAPGGGPPGGQRTPDAGRFLLRVSASPDALMRGRPTPP